MAVPFSLLHVVGNQAPEADVGILCGRACEKAADQRAHTIADHTLDGDLGFLYSLDGADVSDAGGPPYRQNETGARGRSGRSCWPVRTARRQ